MNDQAHSKIALAGAPMVGKTTFMHSFARRSPQSQLTIDMDETKRILHLDNVFSRQDLCIMTASGPFINDTVIPTVLTGATVVGYVISAFACINLQLPDFKEYATCAAQVGAHWDDIPWLFVLNKVDLTDQNPLSEYIPSHFHNKIIRCIAVEDKGVDELWQRLLTLVALHPL